jgi:hypothetical protein
MSQQRLAVLPAFCGTLFFIGWVAGLSGLGAGLHNGRAPVKAATPQATAMAGDGLDGVSVSDRGSVGAALPDPHQVLPPATPLVAIAPAGTLDPVQHDVEVAAPPVEVAIGSISAALPDADQVLPLATPLVAIAPASTPDPVQDDVEVAGPPVEVAAIGSIGAALPDADQVLPPATPLAAIAPASTPDPVQDDAEVAVPPVEVAAMGSVGGALPDSHQVLPPATPFVAIAPASTPDPVQDDVEVAVPPVEVAAIGSVDAALPDLGQALPPATPPVLLVSLFRSDPLTDDLKPAVRPVETPNECLVAEICIDDYLWSFYERTPKVDTNKVTQRIKATVKKKGKTRTVIKAITKYVVGDFTWKDPIAAQRAGMSIKDYVIGGMDRGFKLKLYHALRAMDDAGLMPGITSAFRDDYRQAIASGNKAASDSSYHGGSRRGGYGHGLAADLVSVKGETRLERYASSKELWKWIDARERELGIGRPYLDRDPPHVGPIGGKEYVAKRGGAKAKLAGSATNRRQPVALGGNPSVTKPATKAGSVTVGGI